MSEFVPEGLKKQREYMDAQNAMQSPCWACGKMQSKLSASTGAKFQPYSDGDNTYACVSCETPMAVAVPLVAVGPVHWCWVRPKNLFVTATEWRTASSDNCGDRWGKWVCTRPRGHSQHELHGDASGNTW